MTFYRLGHWGPERTKYSVTQTTAADRSYVDQSCKHTNFELSGFGTFHNKSLRMQFLHFPPSKTSRVRGQVGIWSCSCFNPSVSTKTRAAEPLQLPEGGRPVGHPVQPLAPVGTRPQSPPSTWQAPPPAPSTPSHLWGRINLALGIASSPETCTQHLRAQARPEAPGPPRGWAPSGWRLGVAGRDLARPAAPPGPRCGGRGPRPLSPYFSR